MSDVDRPLSEILGAAEQFLDEGDYQKLVFTSNRLVIVAGLWSNNAVSSTAAVALRMAAQDAAMASAVDHKLDLAQKQEFERLIQAVRASLRSDAKESRPVWTALAAFKVAFWTKSKSRLEGKSYTRNDSFVDLVLGWAYSMLKDKWRLVYSPRASPFEGVLNEVDWIIRDFGATSEHMARFAVLSLLAWESEYVRWRVDAERSGAVASDPVFDAVAPGAIELVDPARGNLSEIDAVVASLSRSWREDFSIHFDLWKSQNQSRLESHEEARDDDDSRGASTNRRRRE